MLGTRCANRATRGEGNKRADAAHVCVDSSARALKETMFQFM